MPLGVLSFTVKLPDGATTADVDVVLPAGTHPTQYLKLRGGQWKDFTSHTTIAGDVVTLHLTDNDEFDTDLAPGVIGDPGAPALGYRFGGFLKPLHEGVNDAHAGRTVPVKWTITDAHGAPIADPASFVNVSSRPCAGGASTVETPTGKGLKYRRGVWQWNWKTPKSYAGQCRDMSLNLADGVTTRVVEVQF